MSRVVTLRGRHGRRGGRRASGRAADELRAENHTALDGSIVWKALVETGKAFELDAFSRKALIHKLRDDDYGRRWVRCGTCSGALRMALLLGGARR